MLYMNWHVVCQEIHLKSYEKLSLLIRCNIPSLNSRMLDGNCPANGRIIREMLGSKIAEVLVLCCLRCKEIKVIA